jgi:hypothetical protein
MSKGPLVLLHLLGGLYDARQRKPYEREISMLTIILQVGLSGAATMTRDRACMEGVY